MAKTTLNIFPKTLTRQNDVTELTMILSRCIKAI